MEFISLLNVQTSVASNSISMFVIQSCIFGGSEDSIQLSSFTKRVSSKCCCRSRIWYPCLLVQSRFCFRCNPIRSFADSFPYLLSFKPISKIRIGYDCSCSSALFDVVLFLWIRCRWLCVWLLHCEGWHGHKWYRDC